MLRKNVTISLIACTLIKHQSKNCTILVQRPEVDPPEQTVSEGDPVRFHCWVRGNADAQIRWSREDGEPLPQGVSANGNGMLYIPNVQLSDAGNYVCSAIDPERGEPTESTSARLIVHARKILRALFTIIQKICIFLDNISELEK